MFVYSISSQLCFSGGIAVATQDFHQLLLKLHIHNLYILPLPPPRETVECIWPFINVLEYLLGSVLQSLFSPLASSEHGFMSQSSRSKAAFQSVKAARSDASGRVTESGGVILGAVLSSSYRRKYGRDISHDCRVLDILRDCKPFSTSIRTQLANDILQGHANVICAS